MIKVTNLHKSYTEVGEAIHVIQGLDLQVKEGKLVVVMGVSGAGKTTLLNLLGGLDLPDSGTIEYDQMDLSSLKGDALADFRNRNVGFVFQFHHLLPEFSVLENVIMPGMIAGQKREELEPRGKELLAEVGLDRRMDHRPGEISGGECQRAAVARALMNKPKIILADEPSGNLDRGNSEKLHQLLQDLCHKHNQSIIVATHNEHLASKADKVLYLTNGVLNNSLD